MATRAPVGLLRTRGLVPDGRCHAPRITSAGPCPWDSIAWPYMRPQPRAAGRGLMRFLTRAPDLALAMWAVFPMPRGNSGQSRSCLDAGASAHGPLCRFAALHPVLIKGSGGTGRFLCVFHAIHARTRTVFCDLNRLFLGPPGKKSQNVADRTADLRKNVALSYNRLLFGVTYRDPLVRGGAQERPTTGQWPSAVAGGASESGRQRLRHSWARYQGTRAASLS